MSLRERIARLWQKTLVLIGVFALVRFHLIVLLVGLVLVCYVDQVQDMILSYGMDANAQGRGWLGWLGWLLAAMTGCALTIWYTARIMLRFRFEHDDEDDDSHVCPSDKDTWPRLKEHLPRWLGAGVFFIVLFGAWRLWGQFPSSPWKFTGNVLGAFVVYALLVRYRRKLFRLATYAAEKSDNNLRRFSELPAVTRVVYWALLGANLLIMVVAVYWPHGLAWSVGPGAVILIGAGLFVVTGSTLVYWSNWFRVPVVTLTFLYVVFISGWSENHLVRLNPTMSSVDFDVARAADVPPPPPRNLDAALSDWVASRRPDGGGDLPIIVVASEGGGARAAYWTAAVLAELDDQSSPSRRFADYVFGISSVSGGSLGTATFAALVTEDRRSPGNGALRARGAQVLGKDFLGPTLATLLFPDLLQRFVPWPVFEDRGMTLEESWERAWRESESGDHFARPATDLWRGDGAAPLLFFNSTAVETGERLVYAEPGLTAADGKVFREAIEGQRALGDEVPLSTAVHNTARFPYVSPAGLVRRRDATNTDTREHWVRLADGGYYENAGALTAVELVNFIRRRKPQLDERHGVSLVPYVIQITNGSTDGADECDFANADVDARTSEVECAYPVRLNESTSPLIALLNARSAHARHAARHLQAQMSKDRYTDFRLVDNGVVHPLGWLLSRRSQDDMTCQVVGYTSAVCARSNEPDAARLPDVRDRIANVLFFLETTGP